MLKFWAFVYRLTGWYSAAAELAEYRYLQTRLRRIEKLYNRKDNNMSFKDLINLEIGIWQSYKGFVRRWKR